MREEANMNNLNSVLIEGCLVRAAEMVKRGDKEVCFFTISSNRFSKSEDGMDKRVIFIEVDVPNSKLAESCMAMGKKGKGCRVVGRLEQDRSEEDGKFQSRVYILAEHVEFRPEK